MAPISPIWKQNTDNAFDILQKELACFGTKGDLIMIGDLNSRTGNTQEHLNNIRYLSYINRLDIDVEDSLPDRAKTSYTYCGDQATHTGLLVRMALAVCSQSPTI